MDVVVSLTESFVHFRCAAPLPAAALAYPPFIPFVYPTDHRARPSAVVRYERRLSSFRAPRRQFKKRFFASERSKPPIPVLLPLALFFGSAKTVPTDFVPGLTESFTNFPQQLSRKSRTTRRLVTTFAARSSVVEPTVSRTWA